MAYSPSGHTFRSTLQSGLGTWKGSCSLQLRQLFFLRIKYSAIAKFNLPKLEKDRLESQGCWKWKWLRTSAMCRSTCSESSSRIGQVWLHGNLFLAKNNLSCAALCKCYAWGCNRCSSFKKSQLMNDNEEEIATVF